MTASAELTTIKIAHRCRLCEGPLGDAVLSLGLQPISNRLPRSEHDARGQLYPLAIVLCQVCGLPQLEHHMEPTEHFHDDYAYLSGMSSTWIAHCRDYAQTFRSRHGIQSGDRIVEVGSNDGTLLKEFKAVGCDVHGFEPSANVAKKAIDDGIPTTVAFFDERSALSYRDIHGRARAVVGNNVLAHVPDTSAFLRAAKSLIADDGLLCFEFPHFIYILNRHYFDTIYHEHYTYLGITGLHYWAQRNGMQVFDVEEQLVHGGSLRAFLRHDRGEPLPPHVAAVLTLEAPFFDPARWHELQSWLADWKRQFLALLAQCKRSGHRIVGYTAASKTTVALNYLGVGPDLIEYCYDASELKQGRFIPGVAIPIVSPGELTSHKAHTVIVFAWNIFDEILGTIQSLVDYPADVIQTLPEIRVVRLDGIAAR